MQKIRLNDSVVVLAGKEKGKQGKVIGINRKTNRVVVEGVNQVKKALRPTQMNPEGGIVAKEASLHISNVSLLSPKLNKKTRVRIVLQGGKRKRVSVKCGQTIDDVKV